MPKHDKSIIPLLESLYSNFTSTEAVIADFFIHNNKKQDFSAQSVSDKLFVSKASLSRFAKKCGFKGYREFIYRYEQSFNEEEKNVGKLKKNVLSTYQQLLDRSYTLTDEAQLKRVSDMLMKYKKVYVYGIGSSGIVAMEFKIRFMRLGLNVESVVDAHIMQMNSVLIDEDTLVIGFTVSGKTKIILKGLKAAKARKAKTIIVTSNNDFKLHEFCDEMILIAVTKNLAIGNVISPQFPMLVVVDILYSHFLNSNYNEKSSVLNDTLSSIEFELELE
ncbi:MurR/RpiR family transcriptional regulator [Clostridium polynesiense]|uniref:MurR/RpiR family transcriptional regulator n=1 Tax=Clostridium polynesiense TaxID=1325933 RepID=UPI00058F76B3|nr:MurR/RpiR family transcriptional regulator [Clostridium polynesiense]